MDNNEFLSNKDVEKVKSLQEKLKSSSCFDERKRLVTKKALVIEKARVKRDKHLS
ncbi:MAG: hypothetical protein ACK4M9_11145 [Anaerobacillus sp.]|uniref:hypothetical protein n=1 Tax=Anaerobacillus sp. TaxID=1872506 RepID=UPI00391B1D25